MKIGVLIDPQSWYLRDLQRAAGDEHDLARLAFADLWGNASQGPQCLAAPWSDCGAVLVRTMPPASLEQVVFRMDLLNHWQDAGLKVVNPPRAMETAVDKYLCSLRLAQASLSIPTTVACQTWQQSLIAWQELGGDVVVKPIFGGEGRGIMRVSDESLALRTFQTLHRLQAVVYLQPFIPHHGFDYRVLLIGERFFVIRRRNAHDWRTNLSRGATAEPVAEHGEWISLARAAAHAIGAPVAGVDILPGLDGELYVLEVNAVPGWRGLQAALRHDIAREVLDFVASS